MKKLLVMAGLIAVMASCKEKAEPDPVTPAPTPPPVENPAPPAAPEPQTQSQTTTTTTTTVEEKDGTSVNISSDGVDFKDKNGENESNVKFTKKKSEIQINRD